MAVNRSVPDDRRRSLSGAEPGERDEGGPEPGERAEGGPEPGFFSSVDTRGNVARCARGFPARTHQGTMVDMNYGKLGVGTLLGLGLVILACGDSTTRAPPLTADQACASVDTALCAKLDSCAQLLVQAQYGDAATCADRLKLQCVPALAAPGSSQTPTTLDACAKSVAGVSCADLTANVSTDACKVKPGKVDNGKACGVDAQCVSTACIIDYTTGCGVCGARVASGGACGGAGQGPCDYGTKCIGAVCKKPGVAGDKCTDANDCGYELACKAGACALSDPAGTPCTPTAKAEVDTCDRVKGVYCQPTSKLCAAFKTAKVGETCGYDTASGNYTVCVGASYCKPGANPLLGICRATVADGASCAPGEQCQPPALCLGAVCKIIDPSSCK